MIQFDPPLRVWWKPWSWRRKVHVVSEGDTRYWFVNEDGKWEELHVTTPAATFIDR